MGPIPGESRAVTEYKVFPDRTHFILGEKGWEQVADSALEWATQHTAAGARA